MLDDGENAENVIQNRRQSDPRNLNLYVFPKSRTFPKNSLSDNFHSFFHFAITKVKLLSQILK